MALIRPINKSNVVTVQPHLRTGTGTTVSVTNGHTYAIYISANGPVTITGGTILSGAPSGSTSGVFVIKATSNTLTISGASDFIDRMAEFTGEITPVS